MKLTNLFGFTWFWRGVLVLLLAGLAVFSWPRWHAPAMAAPGPGRPVPETNSRPAAGAGFTPEELARRRALFPSFQRHPFVVAQATNGYGWTAEDGRDPTVIRRLAHNELEFQRLAEETARISGRQLVYVDKTADLLVQESRLSGEPIRQLLLPGLAGQKFQFEITESDLSPSGEQGTFTGHIAGEPDSTVTLAYKNGREAFTILSPATRTYVVGEPREPGEVIVKSVDPATYVVGTCGNP
jgi:hypothetical protein